MDLDFIRIERDLLNKLGEKRLIHIKSVVKTALGLAKNYGLDLEKVEVAALLHDCAKHRDKNILLKKASDFGIILDVVMMHNEELIHAQLGAEIARREYGISDEDILNAIRYHTTGRVNMTLLEKIIYIADYIEPLRTTPRVETVREVAYENIDEAILMAMDSTISFLIKNRQLISPHTIEARNYLIIDKIGGLND